MIDDEVYLTVSEIASKYGISGMTVRSAIGTGSVPSTKKYGRIVALAKDVEHWRNNLWAGNRATITPAGSALKLIINDLKSMGAEFPGYVSTQNIRFITAIQQADKLGMRFVLEEKPKESTE